MASETRRVGSPKITLGSVTAISYAHHHSGRRDARGASARFLIVVETTSLASGAERNAMMIKATDIRRGMVITMEGTNFIVVDFAHHTPGNLRAMVQTKLRNMNSGALIDKRLRSVDQIEVPYVETKEYEYLYSSGDEHVFMDTETYDQLSFAPEILGTAMQYLLPNSKVTVMFVGDKAVSVDVPA